MGLSQREVSDFIDHLEMVMLDIEEGVIDYFENLEANPNSDLVIQWDVSPEQKATQYELLEAYESWYTGAEELVSNYLPQRADDFEESYYVVKDGISLDVETPTGMDIITQSVDPTEQVTEDVMDNLRNQLRIVKSINSKVEARRTRLRRQLSERLELDELQQARQLFEEDYIRASGVVAAVALERHLLTLCEEQPDVTDYDPTHGISRLAQTLYEHDVLGKTAWNDMKALASIRETCAHAETPEKGAVRRLINDTEEFIRKNETD